VQSWIERPGRVLGSVKVVAWLPGAGLHAVMPPAARCQQSSFCTVVSHWADTDSGTPPVRARAAQ
jgi:hypothetical protein